MSTLRGLGLTALGLGFLIEGLSALFGKKGNDAANLSGGDESEGRLGKVHLLKADPKVSKAKATLHTVHTIEQRIAIIKRLIKKGGMNPEIREAALRVLTEKVGPRGGEQWKVKPKDWEAEVIALFDAVVEAKSDIAYRYTKDMLRADTFSAADRTLKLRGEDCDGVVVYLGSMLEATGHPVKLRVIEQHNQPEPGFSHIYLLTGLPPDSPSRWMALDPTEPHPAGWEAPARLIKTKRDFEV